MRTKGWKGEAAEDDGEKWGRRTLTACSADVDHDLALTSGRNGLLDDMGLLQVVRFVSH
jgi:hypothetical protein